MVTWLGDLRRGGGHFWPPSPSDRAEDLPV